MRLTCPNCSAQYEVPAQVIPTAGRDVQCSSCHETWFQPGSGAAIAQDRDDDVETVFDPPAVRRRELDPGIRDLLREEVAHEARLRALESAAQPASAVSESDSARRERESRARLARLGDPEKTARIPGATPRRDLLPDIEETSASLRETSQPEAPVREDPATRQRNFRIGLALPILAALLVAFVYFNADRIRLSLPQTVPAINSFTGTLDAGRFWLADQMQAVVGYFNGTSNG